jgi:hypothetical protein
MPIKIPRYDEAQIDPQAVRMPQAQGAGPAAFGAGLGQGLTALADDMQQAAIEEQKKANVVAGFEGRLVNNKTEEEIYNGDPNQLGPGTGILNLKGSAFVEAAPQALAYFDKVTAEHTKTLKSEEQIRTYNMLTAERRIAIVNNIAKLNRQNVDLNAKKVIDATIESSKSMAALHANDTDPTRVELEVGIVRHAKTMELEKQGWVGKDKETLFYVSNELKKVESAVRSAVVEAKFNSQNAIGANDYLEKNKDGFTDKDYGKWANTLKPLAEKQIGYDTAKRLFADNPDASKQVVMNALRKELGKNPNALSHGEAEVTRMFTERKEAATQASDEAEKDIYSVLSKIQLSGRLPKLSDIPGDKWSALIQVDPEKAAKLQKDITHELQSQTDRKERKQEHAENMANSRLTRETMAQMQNWSSLVQDPDSLKVANLDKMLLSGAINRSGYKDLSAKRSKLINNPEHEAHIRTQYQIVSDILRAADIKKGTDDDTNAWTYIETKLAGMKDYKQSDVEQAAREAVYKVPQPWYKPNKEAYRMTMDDVPEADKIAIKQALKQRGKPSSDVDILKLYIKKSATQ